LCSKMMSADALCGTMLTVSET